MFDKFKPTTQMLGRWQPWHPGHTELFKRALAETGQVCIMIRTVPMDTDASGGRTMTQDDNPFKVTDVLVFPLGAMFAASVCMLFPVTTYW